METKRLILALALSFAVFFAWQILFPPQPRVPVHAQQQAKQANTMQAASTKPAASVPEIIAAEGKKVLVNTPLYTAQLNTQGGVLEHFRLKQYNMTVAPEEGQVVPTQVDMVSSPTLDISIGKIDTFKTFAWDAKATDIQLDAGKKSLTFSGSAEGYRIQRTLTFDADNYTIEEDIRLTSEDVQNDELRLGLNVFTNVLSSASNMYNKTQIAWLDASGINTEADTDDLIAEGLPVQHGVNWGAVDNNYFIFAAEPSTLKNKLTGGVRDNSTFFYALELDGGSIHPGETKQFHNVYFVGPKERNKLTQASATLGKAVDFGWFGFVAEPLLWFLVKVNNTVHNWGISIIILTIIIKIIFWPLSQKSYKSMEQMKKLQPMIQKIRDKYGNDKQAMNQEIMQLYKTYKVNPAGGCIPMVVQIPVFFGLYRALLGAVELRHAGFIDFLPFTDTLWLADLSSKDPFYITPLVMGATMLAQQLMSPSTGDPTQRKMMLIMPVVFTFLFLQFPAGLVIYWLVNNVLSIAQQWFIMRSAQKKTSDA